MYLIIEKLDFVNISPSFNVVSYSKDKDLADRYAQCKRDEANEQGKENYSYDVVEFMSLEEAKKWKLNKFTMNEDVYVEDVN